MGTVSYQTGQNVDTWLELLKEMCIRDRDYPVQSLGHADLVQTPTGDWYAVFLGKRIVEGGLVPF